MIDRGGVVTVKRQTELLDLTRSNVYYRPRPVSERDLLLMRRLDELHLEAPYFGARKLAAQLRREGHEIGRKHVRTLMRRMGIEAIYRKPRTSIPAREAAIYPYLLENRVIERLWRSVKYEEVYLREYRNGHEAQRSLSKYFAFYNARRVHETLGYATPDEVYFGALANSASAAA